MQTRSITRRFRAAACVAAVFLAGAAASGAQEASGPPPTGPTAAPGAAWHDSPGHLALLAPRLYRDAYRAFVTALDLTATLRVVEAQQETVIAPGSWMPHQENVLDAFGAGATYDRWKLARLFGSRRPLVARGPRGRNGIVEEMWTLVSPYPSADLEHLEPGTLLIVLRIP